MTPLPSGTSGGPLSLYLCGPTPIPGGFVMPFSHLSLAERFWAKVSKTDGCWLWTASRNEKGYGYFAVGRQTTKAHRFAYELFVSPIPIGLTIDHLCRVRNCVNPAHLELVPLRDNILRGVSFTAQNAKVVCCPRGHTYDLFNTVVETKKGNRRSRHCRECRRQSRNRK